MNILLTNFTSEENGGDAAILNVTLKQIKSAFPDALVSLITFHQIPLVMSSSFVSDANHFFHLNVGVAESFIMLYGLFRAVFYGLFFLKSFTLA